MMRISHIETIFNISGTQEWYTENLSIDSKGDIYCIDGNNLNKWSKKDGHEILDMPHIFNTYDCYNLFTDSNGDLFISYGSTFELETWKAININKQIVFHVPSGYIKLDKFDNYIGFFIRTDVNNPSLETIDSKTNTRKVILSHDTPIFNFDIHKETNVSFFTDEFDNIFAVDITIGLCRKIVCREKFIFGILETINDSNERFLINELIKQQLGFNNMIKHMTVNREGTILYFVTWFYNGIFFIDLKTKIIEKLKHLNSEMGYRDGQLEDGPLINFVHRIIFDSDGNLIIYEYKNKAIRKIVFIKDTTLQRDMKQLLSNSKHLHKELLSVRIADTNFFE